MDARTGSQQLEGLERITSTREIKRERTPIVVKAFSDIVPALEVRKADEYVLVDCGIIPTPEPGMPFYYSAQNFSKRGPMVELITFRTDDKGRTIWLSPTESMIETSQKGAWKLAPNERHLAWFWREAPADQNSRVHILRPHEFIAGMILYQRARGFARPEFTIELRDGAYSAGDSPNRVFRVRVPSKDAQHKYDILLEHVPLPNSPARKRNWKEFDARHDCDYRREDFSFRFPHYTTYCHHIWAAYATLSARTAEQIGEIIDQPAPLFSEATARLFISALYDAIIKEEYIQDNRQHTRHRVLTHPEADALVLDAWKRYGNRYTMFVHTERQRRKHPPSGDPNVNYKRMRDYNWELQGQDGVPFIKQV